MILTTSQKILLFRRVQNKALPTPYLPLLDAGDEVIIPTPYWVTYSEIVRLGDATPKLIKTCAETKYKLSPQELEKILQIKQNCSFSSPVIQQEPFIQR